MKKKFFGVESVDVHHDPRFDMEVNWHHNVVPNIPANHTPITVFNSWGGIRGWRFVKNVEPSGVTCHQGSHI